MRVGTKDTPYLDLMDELWRVFCDDVEENLPRYDGTALYCQIWTEPIVSLWLRRLNTFRQIYVISIIPVFILKYVSRPGWHVKLKLECGLNNSYSSKSYWDFVHNPAMILSCSVQNTNRLASWNESYEKCDNSRFQFQIIFAVASYIAASPRYCCHWSLGPGLLSKTHVYFHAS